MSCLITQGKTLGCKDSLGGIKEFFIGNRNDFITGITIDPSTEEIDGLPTATLYRFEVGRGSSSFTDQGTPDETTGTLFHLQTLNAVIRTLDPATRKNLEAAARATPIIFVRDSNDNILCMGRQEGCTIAVTAQTGQAKGDQNGYSLVCTAEEREPAEHLEAFTSEPFDNFTGITISPSYGSLS